MNWWQVLCVIGVAGVMSVGLGLIVSIPAAKRRNDVRHAEQVADVVRHARHREVTADMTGERTEPFRALIGAHSPAQPGRQVLELVAARRARELPRHRRPRGRSRVA